MTAEAGPARKPLALALQGGGAHGAFTWGVLDRLLADARVRIEAISGTSAGAMNAVVLAAGLQRGGEAGARASLRRFWRDVSEGARWSPFRRSPLDVLLGRWNLDTSPGFVIFDLVSRLFSPYDLNPLTHREAYPDILVVAVLVPLVALAALIALASVTGAF